MLTAAMKSSARRGLLLAFLAAAGCTASGPADEAPRAVSRAIDCGRLGAPVSVDAAAALEQRNTPIGPLLNVRLQELRKVSPALTPGRKEKTEDRFAGLVPFVLSESGTHTVLVASLAWADLGEATPPRLVEPQSFKWIDVCGKKFKSGLYALEGGKAYFVQLWDSPDRELAMMIRRLP